MFEQEKKRQRIYDLLNAETKPKFLCLPYSKQMIFIQKIFYRKCGRGGLNKKWIKSLLIALAPAIKKDPSNFNKKVSNELKVHERTVSRANKQDSNPDHNPLDYAIWGVLEK